MVASYEYSTVEPKVSVLPAEGAVATVDERDIDEYRVTSKSPSPSVEIVLSEAATQRIAPNATPASVQEVFQEGPFAVRFDDKFVYGGQCYPAFGAAALRYPVIHVATGDKRRMILAVKPQQAPWIDPNDSAMNTRIDPPALRDYFRSLGKLIER